MDFVGRRRGQIKINIQVDMESEETRKEFDRLKALKGSPNKDMQISKRLIDSNNTPIEQDVNGKQNLDINEYDIINQQKENYLLSCIKTRNSSNNVERLSECDRNIYSRNKLEKILGRIVSVIGSSLRSQLIILKLHVLF